MRKIFEHLVHGFFLISFRKRIKIWVKDFLQFLTIVTNYIILYIKLISDWIFKPTN